MTGPPPHPRPHLPTNVSGLSYRVTRCPHFPKRIACPRPRPHAVMRYRRHCTRPRSHAIALTLALVLTLSRAVAAIMLGLIHAPSRHRHRPRPYVVMCPCALGPRPYELRSKAGASKLGSGLDYHLTLGFTHTCSPMCTCSSRFAHLMTT
jgi:hypothetical protein